MSEVPTEVPTVESVADGTWVRFPTNPGFPDRYVIFRRVPYPIDSFGLTLRIVTPDTPVEIVPPDPLTISSRDLPPTAQLVLGLFNRPNPLAPITRYRLQAEYLTHASRPRMLRLTRYNRAIAVLCAHGIVYLTEFQTAYRSWAQGYALTGRGLGFAVKHGFFTVPDS